VSLSARLSAFFLAALAVVLLGFSTSLYLLAQAYLHRQVEDRLAAALETLSAATETDAEGLEWDPREHHLTLGQGTGSDEVRWVVHDAAGPLVDGSANLGPAERAGGVVTGDARSWQLAQRRLEAASGAVPAPGRHQALVLTVGLSLGPLEGTLHTLGLTLAALSLVLWLTAALAGRWVGRRALAPVTRLAAAARGMSATDLRQRLPSPGTADELEDLRHAFNELLGRVEDAFERQRRFAGDASHQLRTPLAAMLGQVEVALRRDRPAEEYRRALTQVHGQTVHLRRIVEALLFLARADAEAGLDGLEVLDVAAWLLEQQRGWLGHPRAADLELVGLPTEPILVKVQPLLLGQLLENLVDNACKYSEPGSPVAVSLRPEVGVVALVVQDRGCGIAPEDLPHIFEPFYRSVASRRLGLGGVGLGLAMVRRIAATFGGTVAVDSNPDQGSCFTLRLPRVVSAPEANGTLVVLSQAGASSHG
jgi:heavy metal sensor kinase